MPGKGNIREEKQLEKFFMNKLNEGDDEKTQDDIAKKLAQSAFKGNSQVNQRQQIA